MCNEFKDTKRVVVTGDSGNTITLIFQEKDKPDTEEIILDNLMTSYEQRIMER